MNGEGRVNKIYLLLNDAVYKERSNEYCFWHSVSSNGICVKVIGRLFVCQFCLPQLSKALNYRQTNVPEKKPW